MKYRVSINLFILFFSLYACKKSEDKTIKGVLISYSKPIFSKSDSIYIGVKYSKNYKNLDTVIVNLNGIYGKLIEAKLDNYDDIRYLFKFPPLNQTIDSEVKLVIKNKDDYKEYFKPIKIINDYKLETIWDYFSYQDVKKSFPISVYNADRADFQYNIPNDSDSTLLIGKYQKCLYRNFCSDQFITNQYGYYSLHYNKNFKLKYLEINNGLLLSGIQPTQFEITLNDLRNSYGKEVSTQIDKNSNRIVEFKFNKFVIRLNEAVKNSYYNYVITTISRE